ncbi:CDP-glucose 4,6-dehydratase [Paenibacillus farraposensis]|uniref:CDP-glucose 4,6-dehydratase n=1 Tax=Paenibacillus farraposensis TaxID=2807095 RepID=A0ABW4DEI1_9BACL|nr:CDP-glucose 4,6-dehydratase [Paenibacillus farraposensis]MCC3379487.1 CDP-glucose 4,6-dehydratase [Paenibacillus farraposensis]
MGFNFWESKKILITGHTGFKGSWLSLWLQYLGAEVYGYSSPLPVSAPNLYEIAQVSKNMDSMYGDILDFCKLQSFIMRIQPDIIFHLAAQPLVRESYAEPIITFSTNVMGTVHLLEAARHVDSIRVVINVTTDKCYENNGQSAQGFKENNPLGGHDPYSASKACSELVTSAYEQSFYSNCGKLLSSARAGNVVGGGDWAIDRIIPDIIRSVISGKLLKIRYPNAIRPWQHVLDCLNGYLLLAENMWESGEKFIGAWNFGPGDSSILSVEQLIKECNLHLGNKLEWLCESETHVHEASRLVLNTEKATTLLDWKPGLNIHQTIEWTMDWYLDYMNNSIDQKTIQQIKNYEKIKAAKLPKSKEI